jgi:hypothetical protein
VPTFLGFLWETFEAFTYEEMARFLVTFDVLIVLDDSFGARNLEMDLIVEGALAETRGKRSTECSCSSLFMCRYDQC